MGSARNVGRRFFPLDHELELLPGELTPHGHECLVRFASWMPFAKAAETLEDTLGIRVSKGLAERYTEEAGAAYEALQTEEVEQLEKEMPPAVQGADKMLLSADGAMVPLLHGTWAEVRTLVVGEVQAPAMERGQAVVHTRNLSYFSRKVSAQEFQRLALVEIHRRGIETAKEVAAVMDGAEWEQGFTDFHCLRAIRILDFAHAGEHLSAIGEFLHGPDTPESQQWLGERLHQLEHEGPDPLLAELQKLQLQHSQAQEISGNLAYLQKRREQMQYPLFHAQGWPIGSGTVESGNKLVVEARLKGAGMHWHDQHVNPMLTLRNILCSDRWKEEWPKIERRLRLHVSSRRAQLHQSRSFHLEYSCAFTAPALAPQNDSLTQLRVPKEPTKSRPSPWRYFKHGKAQYQPSKYPPKI